jgi:hypothetical protein|tara:strand:- start:4425 stop:5000 length:576 start_codon:yes stop_codon:yes gene_type:complete
MSRKQERLEKIITVVRNIKKEAVTSRKRTGWFDRENMLNRITTAIDSVHRLGATEYEKQLALTKCWKVYLDVQGMHGEDGLRDKPRVPLEKVMHHFTSPSQPPRTLDRDNPSGYSGGIGYAHVNWKYVYYDPKATSGVWGDQYWKPHGRVKLDIYGQPLSLEDSDYWVFRDARQGKKATSKEKGGPSNGEN